MMSGAAARGSRPGTSGQHPNTIIERHTSITTKVSFGGFAYRNHKHSRRRCHSNRAQCAAAARPRPQPVAAAAERASRRPALTDPLSKPWEILKVSSKSQEHSESFVVIPWTVVWTFVCHCTCLAPTHVAARFHLARTFMKACSIRYRCLSWNYSICRLVT